MAGQLHDSLHARLLTLPDELEIFPGHQAGSACGAGISGKPSSTLGFEKRWNRALSMDRASFIEHLTSEIAPRPANMDQIVAANIAAWWRLTAPDGVALKYQKTDLKTERRLTWMQVG